MSTRYYTIQRYDPESDVGCSIPTLNPVTWGKLDELTRRYHTKFPDDNLIVTSMSRDPNKFKNKTSAHNFGYGFDLWSVGLKENSENRAWIAQEAAQLGLRAKDEFVSKSPDWSGGHMHFQEAKWIDEPEGFTPIPYPGQQVSDFVPTGAKTQDQPPKEKHFSTPEFMCPECLKLGRENVGNGINNELINLLEQLRTELGNNPIFVKLGYVCEEHQQTVQTPYSNNGVEPSHLEGRAADIVVINTKSDIVVAAAEKIGFYKVIVYSDNVVHVEVQPKDPSINDMVKEQREWRRIKREREKSAEQTATEKSVADASKLPESQSSNGSDVSSPLTLANMRLEMSNWMKNGLQDTTEQQTVPKFNLWLDGKLINPDHVIIEAGPPKHTEGFRVSNFDIFTTEFD